MESIRIKIDKILFEKLLNLKELVENLSKQPDIALRGGVYKELSEADVHVVKHDNWEIGYKVIPGAISNINRIFVKCNDYKFREIKEAEKNQVMVTVFDVFLDKSQESPLIQMINDSTFKIEQVVTPLCSRIPNMALSMGGRMLH